MALWLFSPSAHHAGTWPRLHNQCRFLCPVPSAALPLLWDVEVLDLLCHGAYDCRPVTSDMAQLALAQLHLDEHDRAARMRAIHCPQIFFAWRDTQFPFPEVPATAALAATRTAMARLIVNFDVNLAPSSTDDRFGGPLDYPPEHIPPGCFTLAPPQPPPQTAHKEPAAAVAPAGATVQAA